MTATIACRELVEIVTDYVEGVLGGAESSRFEQHLLICDGCSAHVDQLRVTRRALAALGKEPLDPIQRADLLAAFRERRPR